PRVRHPKDLFSESFDPHILNGKVIIDLNNRDYANEVASASPKFFEKSLGEELQQNVPGARVVKAFTTIPMETLDTPADSLLKSGAQIFVAGGDLEAREIVARLAKDLGFGVIDLGYGSTAMRVAESLGDCIRYIMIDGGLGMGV